MRTVFGFDDPGNVKKFSAKAAAEMARKSFFGSRFIGEEEQRLPVVTRADLQAGPSDELTLFLVLKLTGRPIRGDERAQGKSKRLNDLTDRIRIGRHRQPINLGDVMSQKRRAYGLKKIAMDRLSTYWSEWMDEMIFVHASGQRGTGDNIQHIELDYKGWPNPLTQPDADHLLYPTATSKGTMSTADVMTRAALDKMELGFTSMIGGNVDGSKMKAEHINYMGGNYILGILHPAVANDLRNDMGSGGMLDIEKQRIAAEGSNTAFFKGPEGMAWKYNSLILHRHTNITYTFDGGPGPGTMPVFRNLFLGAHAVSVAFGSPDQGKTEARFKLGETTEDHEDDTVIKSQVIIGVKASQFNGKDVARFAFDTTASAVSVSGARLTALA